MTRDELEFSICQYLDGTLPQSQRSAIEVLVADDPEAGALLDQQRALTALLRSRPVPPVRWEEFAAHISGAIDEQSAPAVPRSRWFLSLGAPGILALAASVLLAAGIAVHFLLGPGLAPAPVSHSLITPATALLVEGPESQKGSGPAITDVSVGPGGSYAKAPPLAPYVDEIDSRPAHIVIAAGYTPRPPSPAVPF